MGIPGTGIWMEVEGGLCVCVFHSLCPNSGAQVPTDKADQGSGPPAAVNTGKQMYPEAHTGKDG